ncbi:aldehyde dehydrogenase family protein [Alcaligenaceae bacterium]|nr:aldehyde dehydrogenase family protein [Alcaligenaceae bacterium]
MGNSSQAALAAHALAKRLSGHHIIDGRFVPAISGTTFPVINPATGKEIGCAANGSAEDVDLAVTVASKAQAAWAQTSARARGKALNECARRLAEHAEEIAQLLALETGKAIRTESRGEANLVGECFSFYGGLTSELKGETVPFDPKMLTLTQREPIGVVAAIIPWNAPLMLMALKIAPAIAAGNTVVIKSAEEAPLAVLRVIEIVNEVLPAGVANILSGDGPGCGAPLVAHPKVRKVTFTGSVDTGKYIAQAAAEKLIPVTLELGGKSPMIVMGDADLDKAVEGAVSGMRFTRQGQSCTAASRMFVHESIIDVFVEKVKAKVNAMKMGDPLDESTDIGTIISRAQFDRVHSYIQLGELVPGAQSHHLSNVPSDPAFKDGLFVQPVMFTGISNDHQLSREEIFGPVTCVIAFKDYEDVIQQANDSDFALAATIWTNNMKLAMDATQRLQAGLVQVNQNIVVQPGLSYGGLKQSGLGKEASLEAMLEHFTHKKTIIINLA